MPNNKNRILKSLVVYALWIVATLYIAVLLSGGAEEALAEMVKRGIGWQYVAAIAVLLGAIAIFRWNDLRFGAPHSVLKVMWFPALYLLLVCGLFLLVDLPPASAIIFIAINTAMVGFSEEVMFRGILFRAFEERMSIWPAIILTCVLFGAVHALNVFTTGELTEALVQSVTAGLSGVLFIAIVLRTGSLWPAIIYHFLWDFVLFLSSAEASTRAAETGPDAAALGGGMTLILPLALAAPNLICGLILLRNIGKTHQPSSTQGETSHA